MHIEPTASTTRPAATEAAPFYFHYIDQVPGDNILHILCAQLEEASPWLSTLTDASSLHRYAPGKWSIRQVLNHLADTERIFTFRALWFARGLPGELPSFDQDTAVASADADTTSIAHHIEELHRVRLATRSLFANLPAAAWSRSGIASGHPITVRALAFATAGHFAHHMTILRERYNA